MIKHATVAKAASQIESAVNFIDENDGNNCLTHNRVFCNIIGCYDWLRIFIIAPMKLPGGKTSKYGIILLAQC
jgi:hypothetical protein